MQWQATRAKTQTGKRELTFVIKMSLIRPLSQKRLLLVWCMELDHPSYRDQLARSTESWKLQERPREAREVKGSSDHLEQAYDLRTGRKAKFTPNMTCQ